MAKPNIQNDNSDDGVRWNESAEGFTFDGKRWEELEPGAERVYLAEEASRVYEELGHPRKLSDELSRMRGDFTQDEWAIDKEMTLAAQGFSSEEDYREATRKEVELDRLQQEADERRQQAYYDARADSAADFSPQEVAAKRTAAAAAEAELEREQLETNTAPAPARYATDDEPWSPSAADSDRFERQLAGVREGEPIVRDQAPVRARNVRL